MKSKFINSIARATPANAKNTCNHFDRNDFVRVFEHFFNQNPLFKCFKIKNLHQLCTCNSRRNSIRVCV